MDTPLLPRPIDCVVDYEGIIYAFWIFDAGMKQHIRTAIKSYFMRQDIQVNWIFVVDMLQPALIYKNNILLSTTERFFLERSRYDGLEPPFSLQNINDERGLTLHYINPSTKELISYRSLNMVHAPNEYHGQRICNPLSEVDIDFDTGDLAHPGEHESLIFYENKIAELKQREMDILLARQNKDKMVEMAIQERRSLSRPKDIDLPDEPAKKAEYPCIYCGSLTSNWWTVFMHEGKKMCKCCECEEKGITQ